MISISDEGVVASPAAPLTDYAEEVSVRRQCLTAYWEWKGGRRARCRLRKIAGIDRVVGNTKRPPTASFSKWWSKCAALPCSKAVHHPGEFSQLFFFLMCTYSIFQPVNS